MLPNSLIISDSLLFIVLHFLYTLLQNIVWAVTGVQASREAGASGQGYGKSVHVQRILWRRKYGVMKTGNSCEFFTAHDRFDHPSILTDPSISLYGLTSTEAIFLKTKRDVDVYSSDTHPFLKCAQIQNAEMIYNIPLRAFHQLAEEIGDPKLPVIWIWNIGRCGSTLLGQVFEKVPGTVLLNEPDAVTTVSLINKAGKISRLEARQLLRSTIRLQCKHLSDAKRIVLKVASFTFAEISDVNTMFPKINHIFLYRNILPLAQSYKTVNKENRLKFMVSRVYMNMKDIYNNYIRIDRDETSLCDYAISRTDVGLWVILAASIIKQYKEFWHEGIPISAILYEDLIASKDEMVKKIFQKVNISERFVPLALRAFHVDSQRGSELSWKLTGTREVLTSQELSDVHEILELYRLPKYDDPIDLPGRIKLSEKHNQEQN